MRGRYAPVRLTVYAQGLTELLLSLAIALIELVHATGSVNQLLLAGKKTVAGGADFNPDLFFCGARLESIAAGAGYHCWG
jgi:hypothetical protein